MGIVTLLATLLVGASSFFIIARVVNGDEQTLARTARYFRTENGFWILLLFSAVCAGILWWIWPGQGVFEAEPPDTWWPPRTHWWLGWSSIMWLLIVILTPSTWGDEARAIASRLNQERRIRQGGSATAGGIRGVISQAAGSAGGGTPASNGQPSTGQAPMSESGVLLRVLAIEVLSELTQSVFKRSRA